MTKAEFANKMETYKSLLQKSSNLYYKELEIIMRKKLSEDYESRLAAVEEKLQKSQEEIESLKLTINNLGGNLE